jgi:hypothetical protein
MKHEPLHGDFVLLQAGTLRLLLPQNEVGAARYIESQPVPSPRRGLLRLDEDGSVCVALSDAMELLPECPPERFILAPFSQVRPDVGWCWDRLRVLIGARLQVTRLPAVLIGRDTPVRGYVDLDGEVAYLTSAADMCRYSLPEGA